MSSPPCLRGLTQFQLRGCRTRLLPPAQVLSSHPGMLILFDPPCRAAAVDLAQRLTLFVSEIFPSLPQGWRSSRQPGSWCMHACHMFGWHGDACDGPKTIQSWHDVTPSRIVISGHAGRLSMTAKAAAVLLLAVLAACVSRACAQTPITASLLSEAEIVSDVIR